MSITSERLKNRREKLGYTQDELAELINGSQKQVWSYESGRTLPSVDTLKLLAHILETSADYLLGLTDEIKPILSDSDLEPGEIELLNMFRSKTPEKQNTILTIVRTV